MDVKDIIRLHESLTVRAQRLMEKKSEAYNATDDALGNLKVAREIGIVPKGAHGVVVLLSIKLARIASLVKEPQNRGNTESLEDSILDSINYLVLLNAMLKDEEVKVK